MHIDASKSLAELTGVDWGPPPQQASSLVQERYVWHRMPLAALPAQALIRFIKCGIDTKIVLPFAISCVEANQDQLDLLHAILGEDDFPWGRNPDLLQRVRRCIDQAISDLNQWDGTPEILQEANHELYLLYRVWMRIELKLSSIPWEINTSNS